MTGDEKHKHQMLRQAFSGLIYLSLHGESWNYDITLIIWEKNIKK